MNKKTLLTLLALTFATSLQLSAMKNPQPTFFQRALNAAVNTYNNIANNPRVIHAAQYTKDRAQQFCQQWNTFDNTKKVLCGTALTAAGLTAILLTIKAIKRIPKLIKTACKTAAITGASYFTFRTVINPKDKNTPWNQQVKNDISNTYSWISNIWNNTFSAQSNKESD